MAAHYDLWVVEALIEAERAHDALLDALTRAYVHMQDRSDTGPDGKKLPEEEIARRGPVYRRLNECRERVYALKLEHEILALVKDAATLIDERED